MAQRAIDPVRARRSAQTPFAAIPDLGLRGGLGKTLLIAFLLLAIVPLSLLAFLTYHQIQHNTGQELTSSLATMLVLKEAHLDNWVESYERELLLLSRDLALETDGSIRPADGSAPRPAEILPILLAAVQNSDPTLTALVLVDRSTGEVVAASGADEFKFATLQPLVRDSRRLVIAPPVAQDDAPLLVVSYAWDGWRLNGLLAWDSLLEIVGGGSDTEEGIAVSLITEEGMMTSAKGLTFLSRDGSEVLSEGILQVLEGRSGSGAYTDLGGVPVFGAYRWDPDLRVALLAEQSQAQALAAANALTAVVVGATLAVALITAAVAAFATRRLTVPIVQLTETAAWMARGDLNQTVTIDRRDEIGVLARAFNRMAAELRVLYGQLEAKVAERTRQLEKANMRTRHHAMQLALSAEVARVASSIRDVDELLTTVAELIGEAFELRHVSVYLLDDSGERAVWQAGSDTAPPSPEQITVADPTLVGSVAVDGKPQVLRRSLGPDATRGMSAAAQVPVECEMAVPLRVRQITLGVLYLQSDRPNDFDPNDQMVYQTLAGQIGIAIENARAYEVERETVAKLRELDRIQSQFLANMSHALRTPLNSIIGFSRVMLKELDGPLSDLQRADLEAIHTGGRQLLGLINDMLDLSQLDLGTAPFTLAEVDLAEIIEGVMTTTRALARGKPIRLYEEVPADLPTLHTDSQRVRQVILALLSNAVKFTAEGSIYLRVIPDDGHVTISVSDTGAGLPQAERARLLSNVCHGEPSDVVEVPGFGLAISKRVVERLGGQIWVESEEGVGSTFTFTLPIRPSEVQRTSRETIAGAGRPLE